MGFTRTSAAAVLAMIASASAEQAVTMNLDLCHQVPCSVGVRMNTPGDGNWWERMPHKATRKGTSSIWTVTSPVDTPAGTKYKWIIDGAEANITDESSPRCQFQHDERNIDGAAVTVDDIIGCTAACPAVPSDYVAAVCPPVASQTVPKRTSRSYERTSRGYHDEEEDPDAAPEHLFCDDVRETGILGSEDAFNALDDLTPDGTPKIAGVASRGGEPSIAFRGAQQNCFHAANVLLALMIESGEERTQRVVDTRASQPAYMCDFSSGWECKGYRESQSPPESRFYKFCSEHGEAANNLVYALNVIDNDASYCPMMAAALNKCIHKPDLCIVKACTAVDTPYAGCTVPTCTAVDKPYAGCTLAACTTAVDKPYAGCTLPACTADDTPYAGCTVPACTAVDTPYAGCLVKACTAVDTPYAGCAVPACTTSTTTTITSTPTPETQLTSMMCEVDDFMMEELPRSMQEALINGDGINGDGVAGLVESDFITVEAKSSTYGPILLLRLKAEDKRDAINMYVEMGNLAIEVMGMECRFELFQKTATTVETPYCEEVEEADVEEADVDCVETGNTADDCTAKCTAVAVANPDQSGKGKACVGDHTCIAGEGACPAAVSQGVATPASLSITSNFGNLDFTNLTPEDYAAVTEAGKKAAMKAVNNNTAGSALTSKDIEKVEIYDENDKLIEAKARRAAGDITFKIIFKTTADVDVKAFEAAITKAVELGAVTFEVTINSETVKASVTGATSTAAVLGTDEETSGACAATFATWLVAMLVGVAALV